MSEAAEFAARTGGGPAHGQARKSSGTLKQPPDKRDGPILWACGIPFVVWAAVLAAQTHAPALPDWLSNLQNALQHPFSLRWDTETPRYLFFFLLAYGLGIGIYYSTRRTYRRNEEYGSARWGGTAEINLFLDPSQLGDLEAFTGIEIAEFLQKEENGNEKIPAE